MRFVVTGMGRFPVGMLSVDRCWPATIADAGTILQMGSRALTLLTDKETPSKKLWAKLDWKASSINCI